MNRKVSKYVLNKYAKYSYGALTDLSHRQISYAIKNKMGELNELPNNDRNGQQPFLSDDWVLWKMRWAVDSQGASYGLRIMYSVNGKHVVFACIKHKKEIKDDESGFQQETIDRLKMFYAYGYTKKE